MTDTYAAALRLVEEAFAEDGRQGGEFTADGFSNFFPEHPQPVVDEAWRLYQEWHHAKRDLQLKE